MKFRLYHMELILFLLVFCSSAISAQITDPEKEFEFAKKLREDGLHKLSAEQFYSFAEKFSSHEYADDALFLAGQSYFAAQMYSESFNVFKELELKQPQSPLLEQSRFHLAESQYFLQRYEAAAELFRRLPQLHPQSKLAPQAYLNAGRAYMKAGNRQLAEESYRNLITDYPDSRERLDAHVEIVNLYFDRKDYQSASFEIEGIFQSFGPDLPDPRVYWLRAQLYEKLAQTDQADVFYNKLATQFKTTDYARKALLSSASLSRHTGDYSAALLKYDALLGQPASEEYQTKALIGKAEVLSSMGQNQEALELYKRSLDLRNVSEDPAINLRIADLLIEQQHYSEAKMLLLDILRPKATGTITSLDTAAVLVPACLDLIKVNIALKRPYDALQVISNFKKKFFNSKRLPLVLLQEANVYERELQNYSKAIRKYEDFIEGYPTHFNVEDAQFRLAQCYERLGEFRLAAEEHQNHLRFFPGTDFLPQVKQRLHLLQAVKGHRSENVLQKLSDVILNQQTGSRSNVELNIADIEIESGDYRSAIKRLQKLLRQDGDNLQTRIQLARAFLYQAQLLQLQRQLEQATMLYDSSGVLLSSLLETGDLAYLDKSQSLLAQLMLSRPLQESDIHSIERLLLKLDSSNVDINSLFWLVLGDFYYENESDSNAHHKAGLNYSKYRAAQSSYEQDKVGLRSIILNQVSTSDSLTVEALRQFETTFPHSHNLPEALTFRAQKTLALGDTATAKEDYQTVVGRYPYTSASLLARQELADLHLTEGDFGAASDNYDFILDVQDNLSLENGSRAAEILYNRARLFEALDKDNEALAAYIDVIHKYPADGNLGNAKLAIARIAQGNGNPVLAREYYDSLLKSETDPALRYAANRAIADMLFERRLFSESISFYKAASLKTSHEAEKKYSESQSIRCLLGMRQFAEAEQAIKQFKKKYSDTKLEEAQFLDDEGHAFIADKNFERAEKAFKKLRGNYKDTDFGARGEFGLGAVFLITNHTEDALKILTDLPSKYPESEVAVLAYFNLGDFYYKSSQPQNAILAFRNILDHPGAGSYREKALLYLIQCYTDVHMWDQAIAYTREFLEKYPRSEKVFRKRIDLAQLLMNLKEYSRAIASFRMLLPYADSESEAEIQFYIAQCYNESGNFTRAVAEYLKVKYLTAPTKLPWHVTALFETGRCLVRLNDFEQAEKIFKRIVNEQGAESNFGRFAVKQLKDIAEQKARASSNGAFQM